MAIRFALAWYSPVWFSHWPEVGKADTYTNIYTTRFADARRVAEYLAKNRESLWKKIVAWQEVIYSDRESFLVMRSRGISNFIGFDKHFIDAGFMQYGSKDCFNCAAEF